MRAEKGPFDGIVGASRSAVPGLLDVTAAAPGFSQGSNLATMVAAHLYSLGDPADAKGVLHALQLQLSQL